MSTEMTKPRHWQVREPKKLLWRTWHERDEAGDYLTLLYHTESDDTHLLNAVGAEIIQILCEKEGTEEEILQRLSQRLEMSLPSERDLELFLRRMTHAGVLEEVEGDLV